MIAARTGLGSPVACKQTLAPAPVNPTPTQTAVSLNAVSPTPAAPPPVPTIPLASPAAEACRANVNPS